MAGLHGELLRECFGLPGLASVISRSFLTLILAECGASPKGGPAEAGVQLAEAADHPYSRVQAYLWAFGATPGGLPAGHPVLERALDLAQGAPPAARPPSRRAHGGCLYACRTGHRRAAAAGAGGRAAWAMHYMLDHALRVAWLSEAYLLAGRLDEAATRAQHALEFSEPIRNGATKPTPYGFSASSMRVTIPRGRVRIPTTARLSPWPSPGMRPLQAHCHWASAPCDSQRGWV